MIDIARTPALLLLLGFLPGFHSFGCNLTREKAGSDPHLDAIRALGDEVRITGADYYLEGGSIGITLESREGRTLLCGINRASIYRERKDGKYEFVYPHGRLVLHALHVTHEGAVLLPGGGEAEKALLEVIKKASIDPSEETRKHADVETLEYLRGQLFELHRKFRRLNLRSTSRSHPGAGKAGPHPGMSPETCQRINLD